MKCNILKTEKKHLSISTGFPVECVSADSLIIHPVSAYIHTDFTWNDRNTLSINRANLLNEFIYRLWRRNSETL